MIAGGWMAGGRAPVLPWLSGRALDVPMLAGSAALGLAALWSAVRLATEGRGGAAAAVVLLTALVPALHRATPRMPPAARAAVVVAAELGLIALTAAWDAPVAVVAVVLAAVVALRALVGERAALVAATGIAGIAAALASAAATGADGTRSAAWAGLLVVVGVASALVHTYLRSVVTARWSAELTLDAVVAASPAALVVLDPDARVRLWNPAAEVLFGWSAEDVVGRPAPHLPPHTEGPRGAGGPATELIHRSGRPLPVHLATTTVPAADGGRPGRLDVVTDISERRRMHGALRRLAFEDDVTGLANRAHLLEHVSASLLRASVGRRTASGQAAPGPVADLALVIVGLDDFRHVNDTMGHAAGDVVLIEAAQRLQTCLRPGDLAARLGGDEFALALEQVTSEEAASVARRVLALLREPVPLGRAEIRVTASAGVATSLGPADAARARTVVSGRTSDEAAENLVRDADLALGAAKATTRGQVQVYASDLHAALMRRVALQRDLREAVGRDEVRVVYQPIIDLDAGRVRGMEALVRWDHPEHGMLEPAAFIAEAEATGDIVAIGTQVLRMACEQTQAWSAAHGPLSVAVNLSARQLEDSSLVGCVARILRETKLPARQLTLEVTETLLLDDFLVATTRLEQLRKLGIKVAVDDFGTGYSSLAYLRKLPVDILKVDRSFVSDIDDDPDAAALVQGIVELAHRLRLGTVAEGIETAAQLSVLSAVGCQRGQGFHISRPVPPSTLGPLLPLAGDRGNAPSSA